MQKVAKGLLDKNLNSMINPKKQLSNWVPKTNEPKSIGEILGKE